MTTKNSNLEIQSILDHMGGNNDQIVVSVALALAVATSAEAMSPAPLHEPNSMITKSAKPANPRAGIPIRYKSMVSAWIMPAMSPEPNTCVFNGMKAFALSTMGR